MLKNHNFIFLIISLVAIVTVTLFVNESVSAQTAQQNQTVAITTTIDPITILTNELMPLLDTSAIGNLTSLTVTTNLPCDTSNVPKVKIIAGILGNTTNVIDSSSDYTNNKGPRDTCVFTDKITNVTAKAIPAMNRVFLKNTGSTPVHIPEGVMVTLTGIFGKPIVKLTGQPDFQDDYSTSTGWTPVGTTVSITGGKVVNNQAPAGSTDRVHKSLGFTLSNTQWVADVDVKGTDADPSLPIVFSAGTGSPRSASQDMIGIYVSAPVDVGYNIMYKDDAGSATTCGRVGDNLLNTLVYLRLERLSETSVKLSVFSDSSRTTHISGSPITCNTVPPTVTGLTHIQHSNSDNNGAPSGFEADNTKIWNGANHP